MCEFKGTNQPVITWYTGADQEVETGGESPYTTSPGTWENNAVTATLRFTFYNELTVSLDSNYCYVFLII